LIRRLGESGRFKEEINNFFSAEILAMMSRLVSSSLYQLSYPDSQEKIKIFILLIYFRQGTSGKLLCNFLVPQTEKFLDQ
jgi:hypothetical protein